MRNKVFFFGTYEGYRERVELNLNTTVPYQAVRDEVLRALPQPETKIALDTLYLPTEPAEIMPYGRRVASFSVSGLFGTAHSEILQMAGTAYSFEQKFSRGFQRHLVKTGFRFLRETGSHINPEDPAF